MSFNLRTILNYLSLILLTTAFTFGSLNAQKSVEQKLKKEIKKILRFEIEWNKKETPGFIVVVVEPDTSFTVKFGTEANSKEEILDNRLFGIGGLSKVYTSIALAQAIQNNALDTSKTINEVFPDVKINPSIKIYDLVHHKAGFPRTLKMLNVNKRNDYENISYDELVSSIASNSIQENEDFQYNHHDFALLNIWIQRETGEDATYWYKKAQDTYRELPDWRLNQKPITGLNKSGDECSDIKYGVYEPSLGLSATKNDMEKLVRFLLSDNELSALIKEDEIETGINKGIYFSNGLYKITKGKKHTIYGHGGRSINNSASLHFVPETQTGLIILSNSETGVKQLYLPILSMINNNWRR